MPDRHLDLRDRSAVCPFCGGRSTTQFFAAAYDVPGETISVVECQACDLAWQCPPSRPNRVAEKHGPAPDEYFDPAQARGRAELQLAFIQQFVKPGRLLDVGAGVGSFIRLAAEHGWMATGVEPNISRVAPFSERGATLLAGLVEEVLRPDDVFDAVTMFDVVEHIPNYLTVLENVTTRVRSGGVLVIETGNYQSLARRRHGQNWNMYQADHWWYLSPGILKRQLAALGFERTAMCDRVLRPHWRGQWDRPPSLQQTIRSIARRPWKSYTTLRTHSEERAYAARWPEWHQTWLFALAAIKS